jgi:4'-phosphopantetheinyl transferase
VTIDGIWRAAGRTVHWRFGWDDAVERGAASRLARRWVEELVREHELFDWNGIQPARPGTKPRFTGRPDADFSVSHSGRAVMVAVSHGSGLGVDVEAAPFRALRSDALLRRMCSPHEAARARALAPDDRAEHLAHLWTAKEAAVKASGRGLSHDFRSFEFDLPPHRTDLSAVAHLALALGQATVVSRVEITDADVRPSDSEPTFSRAATASQSTIEETR